MLLMWLHSKFFHEYGVKELRFDRKLIGILIKYYGSWPLRARALGGKNAKTLCIDAEKYLNIIS